ncbi:MAG: MFS transporter, partial [Deltaproteobacteria bacterium]|nr:MFS transporter [Deltaproteobacteria bacterium]
NVTIAWQVYQITDSPLQLGLIGLFRALPMIVFSLTGGLLADRLDRRQLLMATQSLAMILAALLGVLTQTGYVQVWHIYTVAFLTGAVNSFDLPVRTAMIPNLVPREHLTTAFALNVTLRQTATLIGPFLAGVILAVVGISWAHYTNALSFVGVIVCLMFIRIRESRSTEKKESALQSMRQGLSFVWGSSVIMGLLVMDTCVNFFGAYKAMMPVFARDLLGVGPTGLGMLLGAPAVGALVGSGVVMGLGNPRGKGRLIIFVTLFYAVGLILFALSRSFTFSLIIAFSLGAFDAVGETLRMTVIQLMTPDHLTGRVQSLVHVFVLGGPLIGQAQTGAVASLLGAPGAITLGGLVALGVVGLMAKRVSQLKQFEA